MYTLASEVLCTLIFLLLVFLITAILFVTINVVSLLWLFFFNYITEIVQHLTLPIYSLPSFLFLQYLNHRDLLLITLTLASGKQVISLFLHCAFILEFCKNNKPCTSTWLCAGFQSLSSPQHNSNARKESTNKHASNQRLSGLFLISFTSLLPSQLFYHTRSWSISPHKSVFIYCSFIFSVLCLLSLRMKPCFLLFYEDFLL